MGVLWDLCGLFFVGIFFVWGRAPTRDTPTEFPFISGIFVGVGLVPTREPKPPQPSFPMAIHSSETAPFQGGMGL
jgi:hypothetical protein